MNLKELKEAYISLSAKDRVNFRVFIDRHRRYEEIHIKKEREELVEILSSLHKEDGTPYYDMNWLKEKYLKIT